LNDEAGQLLFDTGQALGNSKSHGVALAAVDDDGNLNAFGANADISLSPDDLDPMATSTRSSPTPAIDRTVSG